MRIIEQQHVNDSKSSGRHEKGQAAVEFALTAVFLVLLIVAFLEMVMMLYTYNVLADSAKEGVRYAIVHGASNSSASGPTTATATTPPCTSSNVSTNIGNVQTAVTNYAAYSMHNTAGMNVYVCYFDGSNKPPNRVQVTVNYPYQPFFGLGWPTVTVNAAAQGRIMY
ncbi:MAG: hypothetical protein DMG86_23120 [Acidobacteria bacterium]|nr:MAG: hypothetical protein DMG86_23120 [Acidobacteriota bacterium]